MGEKKSKEKNGFGEELKMLCKRHKVVAFVAAVCKNDGVHRMVFYGQKTHCSEIMEDMQMMFAEIGVGKVNKVETPYIQ